MGSPPYHFHSKSCLQPEKEKEVAMLGESCWDSSLQIIFIGMDFYETTYNGSVVHSKVKVEGDWIPTWASTKKTVTQKHE